LQLNIEITSIDKGPQKVNIDEFLATPIRRAPLVKNSPGGGIVQKILDVSGRWDGDDWVTADHRFSKANDGRWFDETGTYRGTAVVERPQGAPQKENQNPWMQRRF
jgi:hypothetical protein